MRGLLDSIGRRLPQGWGDAMRQFLLFFLAYQLYQVARGLAEGREELAFLNADRVIDAERALGTFFEPALQQALLAETWIIDIANWMYINTHFVVTTTFLVWLYLFRNQRFYFVRNMFLVAMALALIGYIAFPTAPPRFIADAGFTDTVASFTDVDQDSNSIASFLVNPYAAMPSMHIAFALMIAAAAVSVCRNLVARSVWALYPLLVFFVIVVTANHFWLDAAAGALVAAVAALAAHQVLARLRPGAWSWRPAAGEAVA